MNSLFFVGDNIAAKAALHWAAAIVRMLLPATLFAIAVLGSSAMRHGNALSDRAALSESGHGRVAGVESATYGETPEPATFHRADMERARVGR